MASRREALSLAWWFGQPIPLLQGSIEEVRLDRSCGEVVTSRRSFLLMTTPASPFYQCSKEGGFTLSQELASPENMRRMKRLTREIVAVANAKVRPSFLPIAHVPLPPTTELIPKEHV